MNQNEFRRYLIGLRHDLHRMPEVGQELQRTISFVTEELSKIGIGYSLIEGGGIIATIGDGPKTILLRADIDALPIREQSGEEFASTNGKMHACGHDLHTAMLLGAGRLLQEKKNELKSRVVLFFEFDEEHGTGMRTLIEADVFEKIGVNNVLALHCLPGDGMEPGTYVCHNGAANSSFSRFDIEVIGKTAHGAMPHKGKNPIHACVQIYNAISNIVQFELDSHKCAVVSICYLSGGDPEVGNIIPGLAHLGGSIRALETADTDYIVGRIEEIAKNICDSLKMECKTTSTAAFSSVVNSPETVELVNYCAKRCGMTDLDLPPQMVSDSFAFLTNRYPGAYVWIGAGGSDPKYRDGVLHSPTVCLNDETLSYGANLLAKVALEYGS